MDLKTDPSITCLLCDNRSFIGMPEFSQGDWSLIKCKSCDLVYTFPFPKGEDVKTRIKSNYGQPYLKRQSRDRRKTRRAHHRVLRKFGEYRISTTPEVLDIGCGGGEFLSVVKKKGWRGQGVDPHPSHVEFCQAKGIDIQCSDFRKGLFAEKSFDFIALWDVLEHFENPKSALSLSRTLLKKNGIIFIQSPNIVSEVASLWQKRWPWLCLPDHRFHFSPKTLTRLLEAAGFFALEVATVEAPLDIIRAKMAKTENWGKIKKLAYLCLLCPRFMRAMLSLRDDGQRGLIRAFAAGVESRIRR